MAAPIASASTLTDAYSSFWVLGDSLSDNGNLLEATGQPPFPYFNGRFSNGPVWNESIIQEFVDAGNQPGVVGAPGFGSFEGNFAYGGARTSGANAQGPIPGLDEQVGLFQAFTNGARGDNPLVSVWAGANNIFQDLDQPGVRRTGRQAANDVAASIVALSALGVNDFVVFNLPDIGQSPSYLGTGRDARRATRASNAFNERLDRRLGRLERNRGLNIIEIDIFSIFEDITNNPGAFGYSNITDQCIQNLTNGLCNPSDWLFWDGVHPTAGVHELINQIVRDEIEGSLSTVPLPAS
ncbi:MAG: SGNH/GDSL hydrolase family protein, partial [Pseudomonadota bacterium]